MHNKQDLLFLIFAASFVFLLAVFAYLLHFYPGAFKTSAMIGQVNLVGSQQEITINFSFPVILSTIEKNITIYPKVDISTSWTNSNRTLKIMPKKSWDAQTNYKISITGARNIFYLKFNQELSFTTQPYPKIKALVPIEGEKNIAVDIEDPIVVSFDSSLENYSVKFEVSPFTQLQSQLNDDKTNIKLLAKNNFDWKTKYQIGVFLKNVRQADDQYVKVGQTSFETAALPQPTQWGSDPEALLTQSKEYTKPTVSVGKYIDVNLKHQVMVIFEDGKALDAYRISSGKKGLETPEGQFKIENKSPRAWSAKYGLFMPNWMAILSTGEVGIHELPVWPGGFQEGANHLGVPVSHGCIRLGSEPAKRVYAWAEIGTKVVVHQ